MNTRPTSRATGAAPDPAVRRVRYATMTGVLVTAVTVSCIVLAVLASRLDARFDVTATREHALAPRTQRIIESLESDHDIVVCAQVAALDRRARQRVSDVLDEVDRASERVSVRWIDTGAPAGAQAFARFMERLADLRADEITQQRETLSEAANRLQQARQNLPDLEGAADALIDRLEPTDSSAEPLRRIASIARTADQQVSTAMDVLGQAASNTVAGVELPDVRPAQRRAAPVLAQIAANIEEALGSVSAGDAPVPGTGRVISLSEQVRDLLAGAADRIDRLEPLMPLLIAETLATQDAVIVVSEDSATAIDFASMFPDASTPASARLTFAGEELIATALATLSAEVAPAVVFVHAERVRLFDEQGSPTALARQAFGTLLDRFALRRIGVTEWAVAMDEGGPEPIISTAAGTARRPIAWVIFPAPNRIPGGGDSRTEADRQERIQRLAQAVRSLIGRGENLLLTVNPSDAPAIGEPDPVVRPLDEAFGIEIDSGRPLVRRITSQRGPLIDTSFVFDRAEADHEIGRAIRGLRVVLPWPSPVQTDTRDGVESWPLLQVEPSPDVWGESQWLALRLASLSRPMQPLALADPPVPNEGRDNTTGPWTVALAARRLRPPGSPAPRSELQAEAPQRLVLVASPSWFNDAFLKASEQVAGRRVWRFPGNGELLESSIYWLTVQDELIAPGPTSADIPRIAALDPGRISLIRWVLIAGLPVGVLLLGVAIRLLRRS